MDAFKHIFFFTVFLDVEKVLIEKLFQSKILQKELF